MVATTSLNNSYMDIPSRALVPKHVLGGNDVAAHNSRRDAWLILCTDAVRPLMPVSLEGRDELREDVVHSVLVLLR